MQTVSQSWKNVHKQTLLNESFVEVSLDIADPKAIEDASAKDNGAVYISNTSETVSEVDTPDRPYGTLEQNKWLLNGQRKSIPESNYLDSGYVGDVLSNEECVFSNKIPTITIEFDEVHTQIIPGVTITWGTAYDEFAEHFIVTAYNGDTVVARKDVIDNKSVTSILSMDIANYNRITIQILTWCLPNCRARVDEIFLGLHKIYSKRDLMSFHHNQTVDPISTSLPKMEIKFSIDNSDDSYNPYNLNGLAKYLTERQEVKTRYGLKLNDNTVEYIKGGSFYLSEWYAKQNGITAEFVARDMLEFMSATYQDTSWDNTWRTLYDLADNVLNSAGLPLNKDGTKKWILSDTLKIYTTTAPLPQDTIANCLQLIANAGMSVMYHDRDGILHIEPINNTVTDYEINKFNSYSKSEITLSKRIKQIVTKIYTYKMGDNGIESSTTENVYELGEDGETIVIDNPLITNQSLAMGVGNVVGRYLNNRMTLKSTGRADVRLDALDIVSNENDYNTKKVRMTNVSFEFNGAFRGSGEGRVIEDG